MEGLIDFVSTVIREESAGLATRWRTQARSVAPRRASVHADEDVKAEAVIAVVADALAGSRDWRQGVMREGWQAGVAANKSGISLPSMLKQLNLLAAMLLYLLEQSAIRYEGPASATDGIRLARSLHGTLAQLILAAVKGYLESDVERARERYRILRHDLRNPLGTIKSALAMMEDKTVPEHIRTDGRFQAMVTRNATSLDKLIGERLGDESARTLIFVSYPVALRDIAWIVRRDLRREAGEADCQIEIADDLPTTSIDPLLLELVLKGIVGDVLGEGVGGRCVVISAGRVGSESVEIVVACTGGMSDVDESGQRDPVNLDPGPSAVFVRELVQQVGGKVTYAGSVRIEIPASSAALSGQQGEDLGDSSEGDDG